MTVRKRLVLYAVVLLSMLCGGWGIGRIAAAHAATDEGHRQSAVEHVHVSYVGPPDPMAGMNLPEPRVHRSLDVLTGRR
jgi:hypothetical protein